jgi:uncharacterized protein (TIGR02996 family)
MSSATMLAAIKAEPEDVTAYQAMADAIEEEGGDPEPWREMIKYVFSTNVGAGNPLFHVILKIEDDSGLEESHSNPSYFVCIRQLNLPKHRYNHYPLRLAKPDDWFIDWGNWNKVKSGTDMVVYAEHENVEQGHIAAETFVNVRPETFVKLWSRGKKIMAEMEKT